VVPKLGSAAPKGAVKDFQGPQGPGKKLRHNLLKSFHWCFKLKTRFSNNFRDILHSNLSEKGPAALSEGQ
ncbi:hypothetical protein WDU94_007363, partial [Cyamophila willieti]